MKEKVLSGSQVYKAWLPVFFISLALLFGLIFKPRDTFAWYTLLHQKITKDALENAPNEIRAALEPYADVILWNSMVPDMFLLDWENHEWNVHGGPSSTYHAPEHIDFLASQLIATLKGQSYRMEDVARLLGLISHYMADVNQPLHTDDYLDDNADVHFRYEMDVYSNRRIFKFVPNGIEFWGDIRERVIQSCLRANKYYPLIMEEYRLGRGLKGVTKITQLCYQSAVSDIIDLWSTIWFSAKIQKPVRLGLKLNKGMFTPGDLLEIKISSIVSRPCLKGDLYLFLEDKNGTISYLSDSGDISEIPAPFRTDWHPKTRFNPLDVRMIIPDSFQEGQFHLKALLVPKGQSVEFGIQLSNRADVEFHVLPKALGALSDEITDEPYLFETESLGGQARQLVVHRWDFIFLGAKEDNPFTEADESVLNLFVPGQFRHVMMYLGRDVSGRPVAIEFAATDGLRLASLPEATDTKDLSALRPVGEKALFLYKSRLAKRLNPWDLERVRSSSSELFKQMELDLAANLAYQMEYYWSGHWNDKLIHLVDDGRENGVSCTDYFLSLLEDNATVCLHGSRMDASAIMDYLFSHPELLHEKVPQGWHPFPFEVSIKDILDMGFKIVDPPPHIFKCDGTAETGVPVPSMLANSPQLDSITPVPVPETLNETLAKSQLAGSSGNSGCPRASW